MVFGPQTFCPSKEFLTEIREYLLSEPRLSGFLDALKNLPSLWDRLVRNDQSLRGVPGAETLERLVDWIQHGELPNGIITESNLFGMPLTIVIHIVQYFHYMDGKVSHTKLLEDVSSAGIQGFCLGLLSAVAVGCARQESEVNALAAVALKLAACIGAYIDLHRAYTGDSFESQSPSRSPSNLSRGEQVHAVLNFQAPASCKLTCLMQRRMFPSYQTLPI